MKRLVIGLVIGLMIGVTGTAIAAQSDTVQAVFQKFSFIVNGQEQQLDADPLVYQGTTYLPVRVVANMLGYDVTYKASDRRIELSSEAEQNFERSENNMDMSTVDTEVWISIREFAQTLQQNGGELSFGGNERLLSITLPTGEQIKAQQPELEEYSGEVVFPYSDKEGGLTILFESGVFLSKSQLQELGALDQ